jgi:TolB-like protein/class 3 adenylate cyclase/tetratricopeptide (TPR) repeat protein
MPARPKGKAPQPLPWPTGTVTFLFTDIEGSTKLWQAQREHMGTAVARHDALVRGCIAAHGGWVFKTGGDAFFAAFALATDAVGAALAAQHALDAERWPAGSAIRVRMALHTGAPELRGGDYFGTPVNQVARLLAAGHGGQTLVSEITRDLCRDHLPAEASLTSLGEHALKDLPRRETIYQLCHPGLPRVFPPLKTLQAPFDDAMPSIAVLPFLNISGDDENEYFADGLSEELLNVLTNIRGLRVPSRTSAFYFKGKDVDLSTIAQKLNVANIVEGSVRRSGSRVRITAQLIQVATDSHLWSRTYDRELDDIFAVQDDIACSVVNELRAALLGQGTDAVTTVEAARDVQAAVKGRRESPEAHRLYLQARFFEARPTEADGDKAIGYYRKALEVDPEYALAWAGLARARFVHSGTYEQDRDEGFVESRQAAEKALQLDPDLAEAHDALGRIHTIRDWNWKAADASFRRALELAPGDVLIMRSVALLAINLGRPEEAIALLQRAVAIDPLNAMVHRLLAFTCAREGDLPAAEIAARKGLELNPNGDFTHFAMSVVRLYQGRLDEALAEIEQEGHPIFRLLGLAAIQHARGNAADSDAALRQLIEVGSSGAPFQIAGAYAYRGDADNAFAWLERAYAQRDPGLAAARSALFLRKIEADPRWQPFLQKLGLAG